MRIAIVNDRPMAVEALRRALAGRQGYEVAWVAMDGKEAVSQCAKDKPDLILMDLIMPVVDGVEATRRIMASTPCPILVVTATVDGQSARVFEALGAGALDAVNTPALGGANSQAGIDSLLVKINTIGKLMGDASEKPPARRSAGAAPRGGDFSLIAIGSSAGGPAALAEVLGGLPANFPAAIVIVQHVDEQFAAGLASWLAGFSKIPVRLAKERDRVRPGEALIAGTSDHLVFLNASELGYTPHPAEYPYRPSVDAFYESVIRFWPGNVTGVLLTGMGRDGAKGLKALRDAGRHTIAQDKETSAVYGMPKAAALLGAAVEILPLSRIAPAICRSIQFKPSS